MIDQVEQEYQKRIRDHANGMIACLIRHGLLEPAPCEVCGSPHRPQGHHDDYRKPWAVRWLCPYCHSQWHAGNRSIWPVHVLTVRLPRPKIKAPAAASVRFLA